MSKKFTSVEYYEIEHRQLLIKLERKAISIGEYAVSSFELFKQALQMEREQIIQAAADHCYPTAQMALNDAERYYEQHYGKCTPSS